MTAWPPLDVATDYGARLFAAYEVIRSAFKASGVVLEPPAGYHLAYWINGSGRDRDRYQDARSRELVEAVAVKAAALRAALAEAWEYSGYNALPDDYRNDDGDKINLCETLFYEDEKAECAGAVLAIELAADMALERGAKELGVQRTSPTIGLYAI